MQTPSKKELGFAALAALVLAVLVTWPLAAHLGSGLPYNERFVSPAGSDNHIWVWDFWWAKEALLSGQSPFTTDAILPPLENRLGLHTHVMLYAVLLLPVTAAFGAVAAVGVAMLLLFAGAFLAMYWVARRWGLAPLTAGFAGFGWAFAPYFLQKSLDHLCHVATPWTPLLAYFVVGALARPTTRRLVGAFGMLVLVNWAGPLFGMLNTLFALALFVVRPPVPGLSGASDAGTGESGGRLAVLAHRAFVPLAVVAAVLVAPPLHSVWQEVQDSRAFEAQEAAVRGVDAAAGFTVTGRELVARPTLGSFLALPELSPFGAQDLSGVPGGNEISALHLSGALLVCALVALVMRRRGRWRWLILALGFLVASWDPDTPLGAPSALYRELPMMDGFRVTSRWFAYGLLPLVVLAALGLEEILRRGRAARTGHMTRWAAPALLVVLVLGTWPKALPMMATRPPAELLEYAASLPERAPGERPFLLTLPSQFGASESMTWQTYHEEGAVVSFLARPNPWSMRALQETLPDLYQLIVPSIGPNGGLALPAALGLEQDLDSVDVRTIVLDTRAFGQVEALIGVVADYLDDLRGWSRWNDDGAVLIWTRNA